MCASYGSSGQLEFADGGCTTVLSVSFNVIELKCPTIPLAFVDAGKESEVVVFDKPFVPSAPDLDISYANSGQSGMATWLGDCGRRLLTCLVVRCQSVSSDQWRVHCDPSCPGRGICLDI